MVRGGGSVPRRCRSIFSVRGDFGDLGLPTDDFLPKPIRPLHVSEDRLPQLELFGMPEQNQRAEGK